MDGSDAKALERLAREIADLEAMDLLVNKRLSVARNERKAILARERMNRQHQDPDFVKKKVAGVKALYERPGYRAQYMEDSRRRALEISPLKGMTPEQRNQYRGLIRKHMTAAQARSIIFPEKADAVASPRASVPSCSRADGSPLITHSPVVSGPNS